MGLLDEQFRLALEGKFGARLEQATHALMDLKRSVDRNTDAHERGTRKLEAIEAKIDALLATRRVP